VEHLSEQLSKINLAYSRFVPHEFLEFLKKESIISVGLGDQTERDMTVLFSDIRSFTTLSETMNPKENFNFINSYLKRVGPIIRNHRGFIDKYIGDAILALFPDNAEDALDSAIAMRKELVIYNSHRRKFGYVPIDIGVGIHYGSLMLGTIGEAERMESTVISNDVNIASRLEGLTKIYGVPILISQKTRDVLDDAAKYHMRLLDRVRVKGKMESIAVFEIFDGEDQKFIDLRLKTLPDFELGLKAYKAQQFTDAMNHFEKVKALDPEDKACQVFLERLEHILKHGVADDWDGTMILESK
jgi:two-component system sensor histidine kinase ChiS